MSICSLNCTSVILILGFLRRCVRVCSEDSECLENGNIVSGEDKFEVLMDSINFAGCFDIYESILIELMNQNQKKIFEKTLTKMSYAQEPTQNNNITKSFHRKDSIFLREILQAHEHVFQEACERKDNNRFIEVLISVGIRLHLNKDDKGLRHFVLYI